MTKLSGTREGKKNWRTGGGQTGTMEDLDTLTHKREAVETRQKDVGRRIVCIAPSAMRENRRRLLTAVN